ncbi:phosphoglycerate mutase [Natronincola peptidivorans]|uniref:Phosphoglycerate mutase n=1 Tax=Natronincola peptidivorans TaxID=426128 RepID=A0A1I0CCI7_9FIRM|nr:histidine phosphatase family protein [Natronincola peptidivorans]SET17122.1 phosphoglycerate mutase [Natronincola peptidivorans]
MLSLYLVRHGETEWNIEKRMQGWQDSALTEKGIEEAEALHDYLINTTFDAIYSSPSPRAYNTGRIVRGDRKIEIIKEENLREINLGDWEGKTSLEVETLNPKEYNHFWKAPHKYKNHSGESFLELQNRGIKAINSIIEEEKQGNVLILTHAVTLKAIMGYFEGRPLEEIWEPPYIHNTSVSLIEIENGESNIVLYGDISHLAKAQEAY